MDAHKILSGYFKPAGLTISKRDWYIKEDGTFSFHGIIDSLQEGPPTCIKGAVHGNFTITASTPDEVVSKLFEMAKTEKLWLGKYNDYHSVIEWDSAIDRFTIRELTEEEEMNNSVY